MSVDEFRAVLSRLENVADRFEGVGGTAPAAVSNGISPAVSTHERVVRFDDVKTGKLQEFKSLTDQIGGAVLNQQVALVLRAFNVNRDFIVMATQCKPPANEKAFGNLPVLKELSKLITEINDVRDKNRANKEYFNHLSAISESIGALAWVTVAPTPAPHVKEMADAAQFYTNRILREYKDKDPKHGQWTKAWIATLKELEDYVKKYHTTGMSWNKSGPDAATYRGSGKAAPPPPPGGVPPPPPPPTLAQFEKLEISSKPKPKASGDVDQLFASLNQGSNITANLKKVSKDQMTHKNPDLRKTGVVSDDAIKKSPASKKAWAPAPVSKPPVTENQGGKKWIVEYHKGNPDIVLEDVNMRQTVYIYKCENSTVQVRGKINSITLDSCKKVALVFEDVVSTVDIVNCQSMQIQSKGVVPTIAIAKTDGCQVYLCEQSLKAEIVTSKSSEMNVGVPSPNGFDEFPIPEQFKTTFDGKKLHTEITEIV